jgi:phosphoribosylformylglycinamidine synthase subunit PurL
MTNPGAAVDLGNGLAVVLATAPGDVVAQGAQPIALLQSWHFGEVAESERARDQLAQAVAGIGDSAELPTVAGEVYFEQSYEQSFLTKTLAVGVAPIEDLVDAPADAGGDVRADLDLHPEQPTEPMYPKGPMVIPTGWSGGGTLVKMLGSANLASRQPVFGRQETVAQLGEAAAAIAIGGNGRRAAVDPRKGAAEAVYDCAAKLACVGAEPLGVMHMLSVGNVEQPNVAWQLSGLVEGLTEACEDLGVPIVAGDISVGNESVDGPVLPTPMVAMLGTLPDAVKPEGIGFRTPGEQIALVGAFNPLRDGAEIAKLHGHPLAGMLPFKDVAALRLAQETVRDGVRSGRFTSAHAIAAGGIAVALARSCIAGGNGAQIKLPAFFDVFGEDFGTAFLVTGSEAALAGLNVIGEVGGEQLDIFNQLVVPVAGLEEAYAGGLPALLVG